MIKQGKISRAVKRAEKCLRCRVCGKKFSADAPVGVILGNLEAKRLYAVLPFAQGLAEISRQLEGDAVFITHS